MRTLSRDQIDAALARSVSSMSEEIFVVPPSVPDVPYLNDVIHAGVVSTPSCCGTESSENLHAWNGRARIIVCLFDLITDFGTPLSAPLAPFLQILRASRITSLLEA